MFDRHEVQVIAISFTDDSLTIMQFITRAWSSKAASSAEYQRDATDEAIEAEIARHGESWATIDDDNAKNGIPPRLPVVRWRRIAAEDVPTDRVNRDAWTDDGNSIAVDPARIKPAPVDPAVAIADLMARLEALEAAKR